MAQYRLVQLSFWTDSKVIDDFTPEDRYFYLYLMTNPHTNLSGCYEISLKQMSDETGYSKETVQKLLDRMQFIHKVIAYSVSTKEVLIIKWSKYNWTSSDKFRTAVGKEIEAVKDPEFKTFLMGIYEGEDTVSIPYPYPMDTTNTNTNTITITDTIPVSKKKSPTKFVPPTYDELSAYAQEIGSTVNLDDFLDYYDSNGWMIGGKTKMKDWKATLRRWSRNKSKPTEKKNNDIDFLLKAARGEA